MRIIRFYSDGFRSMTVGRTLWLIIFIKLAVMFGILKVFFFPDYLDRFDTPQERQDYVSGELVKRAAPPLQP